MLSQNSPSKPSKHLQNTYSSVPFIISMHTPLGPHLRDWQVTGGSQSVFPVEKGGHLVSQSPFRKQSSVLISQNEPVYVELHTQIISLISFLQYPLLLQKETPQESSIAVLFSFKKNEEVMATSTLFNAYLYDNTRTRANSKQ